MSLEFRHIAHVYGQGANQLRALEDISFTAPTGEITCLLGSSGCGKSTLLNLAAGLLPVQQGSIRLGSDMLADPARNPPPEKRPVGMVFQDGALFPHMTVAQNVGFGMEAAGTAAIESWLDHVGLAGLGSRYPHELSGGQQQRAALARAMAPGPQVLLMDEPFASVDIVLRRRLRRDCRIVLREQGATAVLVTHDPSEALDVADRIAVMEAGRVIQFGTPHDLHEAPATASVGAIFGGAQVVTATREGEGLRTQFGTWLRDTIAGELPDASEIDLLLFAENLDLVPDPEGMTVRDVHPSGQGHRVLLRAPGGAEITVETASAIAPERKYRISPKPSSIRAFERR